MGWYSAGRIEAVAEAQPLAHFHASAPYLAPLEADPALGVALDALSRQSYDRWVSIEMRRQTDGPLKAIEAAVQALRTRIRRVRGIRSGSILARFPTICPVNP